MDICVGLIVNPVAGLGGPIAQKGSDAVDIRDLALRAGVASLASDRANVAVQHMCDRLASLGKSVRILAGAADMGSDALASSIVYESVSVRDRLAGDTTSADTKSMAQRMVQAGVDLLLFAGGDGTARDIMDAVGSKVPVLGIPAGVKIYSAVFGLTPTETGLLAADWLSTEDRPTVEREVVDIDEVEIRRGAATPSLYGLLELPADSRRLQPRKASSPASDANATLSLGAAFAATMLPGRYYVLGPGGTTMAIGLALGLSLTRLGVDVVRDGQLVAEDVAAEALNALTLDERVTVVVTPLGQQGFVIGRGNQQIDHRLLQRSELKVVATPSKIISLGGRPLWVDSGLPELDAALCGYTKVFTGPNAEVIYPVSNTADGRVPA